MPLCDFIEFVILIRIGYFSHETARASITYPHRDTIEPLTKGELQYHVNVHSGVSNEVEWR